MKLIFKYARKFAGGLILAVLLLFVQAICDLNLPNYMSEIVNVGIQQSGIDHAAPDALSVKGYEAISTILTTSEKQLLKDSYKLVSGSDKNSAGKKLNEIYPSAGEQLYVKNTLTEEQSAQLDRTMGVATWTFVNIVRMLQSTPQNVPDDFFPEGAFPEEAVTQAEQPTTAAGGLVSSEELSSQLENFDASKIYEFLPRLSMLPAEMIVKAHDDAAANDDMLLKQSGIQLARAFYNELGHDASKMQTSYILKVGLNMLLIALTGGVATVLVSFISSKVAAGFSRNVRSELFEKIESFSNREFDKFSTSSLITRCTNDVTQIQMLLMFGIRMVFYAPIMGIGGTFMALRKSTSMSWIIAVVVLLLLCLIAIIVRIVMPKFKSIQKLIDKLNLVSRESLSGLLIIRAFGTQDFEKNRFDKANQDLTKVNRFVNRVMVLMFPMMMLFMNGMSLIVVWVGSHQVVDSMLQIGDMMAFIQYAVQIIMSFVMISMMFVFVPRAMVSVERIDEVLTTEASIVDPVNPKPYNKGKKGHVKFENVSFCYDGAKEDALSDISFEALPGQTTAIIGSTGAGKTTVANLIMRFYDATKGRILVSDVDVKELSARELRSRIGYVPQKGVLISGTIASNIKYGNNAASEAEIDRIIEVAQAKNFIAEKENGIDSEISQGGTNVSGGQRQRLSIARALAVHPDILIFDDSFSALDFKTDAALRRELKDYSSDATVIVVAQRVSTIMKAEQIIVLNEGKIVGRGTHSELLKNCPEYYEIASTQLTQEELS